MTSRKDLISYIYVRPETPRGEDASGHRRMEADEFQRLLPLYPAYLWKCLLSQQRGLLQGADGGGRRTDTLSINPDSLRRTVHVRVNFYEARTGGLQQGGKEKGRPANTIPS